MCWFGLNEFGNAAARGIKCLHLHDIIHRDVSTKNLLVTKYQNMWFKEFKNELEFENENVIVILRFVFFDLL